MSRISVDVLIVGGTPAGCSAAITAARLGKTVCILEPTVCLGGANSNGQDGFETASLQAIGGIGEEFAARVRQHYAATGVRDPLLELDTELSWEDHLAHNIWLGMIQETPGIEVIFGAVAVDAITDEGHLRGVVWEKASDVMGNLPPKELASSQEAFGTIVIDATSEGDVAAWAGVPFRIGREERSADEPHAGVIYTTYMDRCISDGYPPYTILPGSTGEGDDRLMAFVCRLCVKFYDDVSEDAPHRIKAPPPGYSSRNYKFDRDLLMPNGKLAFGTGLVPGIAGKFHLNRMFDGNDLCGPNRQYVLSHPRERAQLRQCFIDHALGFLYYIQTEAGLPEIGLANDEFVSNNNIPYQIYVREGRRIEGYATVSEADINPYIHGSGPRPPLKADAIAIGDYEFDVRKCRDECEVGRTYPEGAMFLRSVRAPYQVSYGCIIPRTVEGLVVPCALSATHVAYGAVRLEAVRFQTGMAAGIAASLAIDKACALIKVPVPEMQEALISYGGKLTYFSDVETSHPQFAAIQWAALRSYVPESRMWRFYPDQQTTWGDLATCVVKCLRQPISVTGAHFVELSPCDSAFRYVETLYDLGSRAGVDIFGGMRNPRMDPHSEFHRAELRTRWLHFDSDRVVTQQEASDLIQAVSRSLCSGLELNPSALLAAAPKDLVLTRGVLCKWLHEVEQRLRSVPPRRKGERRNSRLSPRQIRKPS